MQISKFGVDLGTLYTKTSDGDIFPSGVSTSNIQLASKKLIVDGKTYRMELSPQDSDYDVNVDKTRNRNIYLCYVYALTKNIQESTNVTYESVITILPYSQWENDETVNRFKKLLDLKKGINVNVNGHDITLAVNNLSVVPEGFAAYELLPKTIINGQPTLITDIGSRTMHQLYFNNHEFVDGYTEPLGVLPVLQRLSGRIQTLTGKCIPPEVVYQADLPKEIARELNTMLHNEFIPIYRKMRTRWDFDIIKHFVFIGGGSLLFENVIYEYFSDKALVPSNAQTITAKALKELI